MPFVSLVWNGRIEINLEMMMTIRDETTERIVITVGIVRVTRGMALVGIVRVKEIVRSPSTSPTPPHLAKKTGIATDLKRIEKPEAVLESKHITALIAVEEDLRVQATFPLQMNEGEGVLVIRMLPHPLTLLFLDLPVRYLLRIRTPVLPFLIKIC